VSDPNCPGNSCLTPIVVFAHGSTSALRRIRQAASNLLYGINPSGFRILRKLGMGGKAVTAHPELADHLPGWESADDHFMVLLHKP
jgi:hypothetical protein